MRATQIMTDPQKEHSSLWEYNNASATTKARVQDIDNFKASPANYKLALWDPETNGVRYLKYLIASKCATLTPENWTSLDRIKNRHVGNPIQIRFDSRAICLDYLQAVLELEFLEKNVSLDGMNILEIGAGYGRTAHAIISNHDVKSYQIVDLENSLILSHGYLSKVLDEDSFSKIRFIEAKQASSITEERFDLAINIDSFAEMDAAVVHEYLNQINGICDRLYVKNPVGKYLDKSLDGHSEGEHVMTLALGTGVLRDVIDIFDDQVVREQSSKFIDAYRPGDAWHCIDSSLASPYCYYWQAIYENDTESS